MLQATKARFATSIGWVLALAALIVAIVVWISAAGWTTDRITLEFVLLALAVLL